MHMGKSLTVVVWHESLTFKEVWKGVSMDWVMSCLFFSGIGGFECFCGLGDCECFWDCVVWGVSMDLNRQKVLKIVQVHTFYFF